MFKITRHITRSTRFMGLLGLLVAAAALSAGTTSASAASVNTSNGSAYGKVNVFAYNAMQAGLGGLANASITVSDANGQILAKGATDSKGQFSNYVQQGTHAIKVTAQGFQGFSTQIKIEAGKSTTIQAGLMPLSIDPIINIDPAPVPVTTPTPVNSSATADPTLSSFAAAQGKLSVYVENRTMGVAAFKAAVLVLDQAGAAIAKGETNSANTFGAALNPGKYTVVVQAQGFNDFKQQVEIVSGKLSEIKVSLTPVAQ